MGFTEDEIRLAESNITSRLPDEFTYQNVIRSVNDINHLKELYTNCSSNYEKLQIFRIIFDRVELDDILKQYINKTYHIENDYLFQLDPAEYDTVPGYIVDICDEMVNSYVLHTTAQE